MKENTILQWSIITVFLHCNSLSIEWKPSWYSTIYSHTSSRNVPMRDISLDYLTLTAPENGDFVELFLPYTKMGVNLLLPHTIKAPYFTSNSTSLAIREIVYCHRPELLQNDLLPVKRHVLLNQPLPLLFPSTAAPCASLLPETQSVQLQTVPCCRLAARLI